MLSNVLIKIRNRLRGAAPSDAFGQSAASTAHARSPSVALYTERPAVDALDGGYSETGLNEYIVLKTSKWFEQAGPGTLNIPPHLYGLLFILESVSLKLGRKINVVDFGGGAPVIPWVVGNLGLGFLNHYRIIEQETFLSHVPGVWAAMVTYGSDFGADPVDIVVISSVLPYISAAQADELFGNVGRARPRFVYLGRTSFLRDDYPLDEVYTIQESVFKDHGPQIPTGLDEIEKRLARYPRRHFKRTGVDERLEKMSFQRILTLQDDSGVSCIDGLGLYSTNSLWERRA